MMHMLILPLEKNWSLAMSRLEKKCTRYGPTLLETINTLSFSSNLKKSDVCVVS